MQSATAGHEWVWSQRNTLLLIVVAITRARWWCVNSVTTRWQSYCQQRIGATTPATKWSNLYSRLMSHRYYRIPCSPDSNIENPRGNNWPITVSIFRRIYFGHSPQLEKFLCRCRWPVVFYFPILRLPFCAWWYIFRLDYLQNLNALEIIINVPCIFISAQVFCLNFYKTVLLELTTTMYCMCTNQHAYIRTFQSVDEFFVILLLVEMQTIEYINTTTNPIVIQLRVFVFCLAHVFSSLLPVLWFSGLSTTYLYSTTT